MDCATYVSTLDYQLEDCRHVPYATEMNRRTKLRVRVHDEYSCDYFRVRKMLLQLCSSDSFNTIKSGAVEGIMRRISEKTFCVG